MASALALACVAIVTVDATLFTKSREPCQARVTRLGGCLLLCLWSPRLCRQCCSEPPDVPDGEPGRGSTTSTTTPREPDFPPDFPPSDTVDAVLETAAHILAIASGEDSESIRVWIENPDGSVEHIASLASKLAAVPGSPYGMEAWAQGLAGSRDRPFTLLRQALALRKVQQEHGFYE